MNIFFTLAAIFSFPGSERAYLDPGSGSFILQLLIASLLGGIFVLKAYWKKVVSLFRKNPSETPPTPDDDQPEG